jgi:hypothetical protein
LNKNVKIFFNYLLIPILLIWFGFNLYSKITHQQNNVESWNNIKAVFTGNISWKILAVIALMFVNWAIEAIKWQMLMSPLQKVSFITAYKAIFAGTSFAANTPNRVGEYFGRMIYIDEGKRLQSVPLTISGSFSQLIVTLVAGSIGLFFYKDLSSTSTNSSISNVWLNVFFTGSAFVSIVSLLLYFKLSWISKGLTRIPFIQKYEYFFTKVEALTNLLLSKVLLLSALRYGIFLCQYILIMSAFGVEIDFISSIILLTVMLLILSIVPSFVIIEAGIRSTVGVEIFKVATSNDVAIISMSLFIWLINLMIPAIIGVLLLLGKKLFKK